MGRAAIERFAEKVRVDQSTGCWEWQAYVAKNGYGQFGKDGRVLWVHRFAYEAIVGEIPSGLEIDHLCRNRKCCNPAHLEPVEHKENLRRGENNNRNKTHCKHGHEYTPENTYVFKLKRGGYGRQCKTCQRKNSADWYRRKYNENSIHAKGS